MELRWNISVKEVWDHDNLVDGKVKRVIKEVKTLQYKASGIWIDVPNFRENDDSLPAGFKIKHAIPDPNEVPYYAVQIKKARNQAGWTQSQLGVKLGLTQNDISRLESGNAKFVDDSFLLKLASLFNRDMDFFHENKEN